MRDAGGDHRAGVFAFEDFEVDEALGELRREGHPVEIHATPLRLLRYLLRNRGRVLAKEEILDRVWPGVAVSDGALSSALKTIRRALGDDGSQQRLVQTLRGRGYRWVAPVVERAAASCRAGGPLDAFVGRASILAGLGGALEEALAGGGRIALLVGEAGIGKTRTAEELGTASRARGIPTHVAWCHESRGAPPYWLWRQILRALAGSRSHEALRRELAEGAGWIARIVPEIRRHSAEPLEEPIALDSEEARFRLFDAVCAYLGRIAAEEGLVLIADDLQWADPSSLALLDFLAHEIGATRVLLVGCCRASDADPDAALSRTLAELARHDCCVRLQLEGLARDEVTELVRQLTGQAGPAAFTDVLLESTDGNPFLVRETVRLLEGRPPAAWHVDVPATVSEVIRLRLDQLSPAARETLERASVLGAEFAVERLARVSELDREALAEAIEEARRAELVKEHGWGRYRFSHALFRQAVYSAQTPSRIARLHQRFAEALEQDLCSRDPGAHLAELAHHFGAAAAVAGPDKAIAYSRQAGDRAMKLPAFEQAAAHYARALELLDLVPAADPVTRCDLQLALGAARRMEGDRQLYREAFGTAAGLARELGDAERLGRAAIGFVFWNPIGLVDEPGAMLLEEALDALGPLDSAMRVELLARLAHLAQSAGRSRRADRLLDEATERAKRIGDPGSLAAVWLFRGFTLDARSGAPEVLRDAHGRALELAQAGGSRERTLYARMAYIRSLLMLGDLPAVEEHAATLRKEARCNPMVQTQLGDYAALQALIAGRLGEAERLLDEGLVRARRLKHWALVGSTLAQLYLLRREQGRLSELETTLRSALEQHPNDVHLRCYLTHLAAELGRAEQTYDLFERSAEDDFAAVARRAPRIGAALLAEPCVTLADRDRAEVLYELLRPQARYNLLQGNMAGFWGSAARPLGVLATLLCRFADAEQHFQDALAMNGRMGATLWVLHTQCDLAHMLRLRNAGGDDQRARELAGSVLATARQLGLPCLAARAVGLQQETQVVLPLRRRPRRPAP